MSINSTKHGAKRGIVSGIIAALAALGATSIPLFMVGTQAALVTYLVAFVVAYRFVRKFYRPSLPDFSQTRSDSE